MKCLDEFFVITWAGSWTTGNIALNGKLRYGILELPSAHVNYEVIMFKKISPKNRVTYISYHEHLSEGAT